MIIRVRNYGENHVIISIEGLRKLVEIVEKIEPVEISIEVAAEAEIERHEKAFERKLLAEGFITNIPARDETDDDDFEPIEVEGESFSETITRERK